MEAAGKVIRLTRQELYDQVWSTPMRKLALRYGLSDVGLAKICARHDIPRPLRGYWAKKEFGKAPPQTPLPNPQDNHLIELREPIEPRPIPPVPPPPEPTGTAKRPKEPPIQVGDSLRGAHKLVSAANQELQVARTDEHGLIVPPERATLEVRVSKASLRRALLIMDAVLKALDQRGYPVESGPTVRIQDVTLRFGIAEELETRREEPQEHDLDGHYSFGFNRFVSKRVASGRLALTIHPGERYWGDSSRTTWRDTQKRSLEKCLDRFVEGLIQQAACRRAFAERQRQQEEERRAAEARRQEEERLRAEKRALFKAERARLDALLQQARDWRQSQDLRQYIEAATQKHMSEHGQIEPGSPFAQWLEWAGQHADRLDPLRPTPPSILDEKIEEEVRHERGTDRLW